MSLTLNGGLKDNFLPKAAFDNSDYLMKQNFLNRVTFKRVIDFIRGHNHVTFDELLPKVRSILAQFGAPEKVINICLDCLKQIHQKISPSIEPNLDNPKLFLLNISIILQYINLDGNTPVFANYCDSRGLHSRTGVLLYHYAFYFPNLICNLISEGQKSGAFDIVKISPNDLKKKSIEYSLKWLKLQFATFPITLIAFMLNFILAPLEVIFLVTNLFDSFVLRLKLVINSLTGIIWNIILTIFWTIIRPIFWNIILPIFWGPSWGLSNPFIRLALTIDFIILALIIVLIIVLPYRWANKALENWLKLHYKIYTSLQFSTELLFKAIDWGLTFVKTVKESLFLSIELLFKAIDWASTFVKTVKEYPLNLSYV